MYLGRNGLMLVDEADAGGGKVESPTAAAPDRYAYYPGTEELGKDEIRVIACGTDMPSARRSQAATCFLIELGNGDKLLFDIGSGSHANVAALMIPSDFLRQGFSYPPAHRSLGRPCHAVGRRLDRGTHQVAASMGARRRDP